MAGQGDPPYFSISTRGMDPEGTGKITRPKKFGRRAGNPLRVFLASAASQV